MPIVPAAELERLTAEIFAARNVPRDDADWIAMLLVRANLRGHDSHGVIRGPPDCGTRVTPCGAGAGRFPRPGSIATQAASARGPLRAGRVSAGSPPPPGAGATRLGGAPY